jgi:hypothetical protein
MCNVAAKVAQSPRTLDSQTRPTKVSVGAERTSVEAGKTTGETLTGHRTKWASVRGHATVHMWNVLAPAFLTLFHSIDGLQDFKELNLFETAEPAVRTIGREKRHAFDTP